MGRLPSRRQFLEPVSRHWPAGARHAYVAIDAILNGLTLHKIPCAPMIAYGWMIGMQFEVQGRWVTPKYAEPAQRPLRNSVALPSLREGGAARACGLLGGR